MIPDLHGLPGAERVQRGLADLQHGRRSIEALWLAAAATRLRFLGLPVPTAAHLPGEPEIALYEALGAESDDPYYLYNAWRAELNSFLVALEARVGRARENRGTPLETLPLQPETSR
jgi:hypothetical protein